MGAFIAIEGGDGSGKGTHAALLKEWLDTLKKNVLSISFPRYEHRSSHYASQYLNGVYGGVNDVHAELASLAYALDRFAAADSLTAHLAKENSMIISDRYVASNLAHQGAKISDKTMRHQFYEKLLDTEYDILGIPKPDLNIVLLVPSAIAQANVDKKAARQYTKRKRDIHEADADHLEKTKANYEELCQLYPETFQAISCVNTQGVLRSIADIQEDIRLIIKEKILA